MTLIYARQLEDVMYCFADTASSNQMLKTYDHAIQEPLIKIVSISAGLVLAFAGDEKFVARVNIRAGAVDKDELVAKCLESANDSRGTTDFLVLDRSSWSMTTITHNRVTPCRVQSLGLQEAKEHLAAERSIFIPNESTSFEGIGLPEGCCDESEAQYSSDLRTFLNVMDKNHPDYRGVATPYAITRTSGGFLHYFRSFRGPIEPHELGPGTPTRVAFVDKFRGQCNFTFGGGEDWLAYHFFEPGIGVFATTSRYARDVRSYTNIHQHDFIKLGKELIGEPLPLTKLS